jgi:hypothetical protein
MTPAQNKLDLIKGSETLNEYISNHVTCPPTALQLSPRGFVQSPKEADPMWA